MSKKVQTTTNCFISMFFHPQRLNIIYKVISNRAKISCVYPELTKNQPLLGLKSYLENYKSFLDTRTSFFDG
jgi:hypothetical protein